MVGNSPVARSAGGGAASLEGAVALVLARARGRVLPAPDQPVGVGARRRGHLQLHQQREVVCNTHTGHYIHILH